MTDIFKLISTHLLSNEKQRQVITIKLCSNKKALWLILSGQKSFILPNRDLYRGSFILIWHSVTSFLIVTNG